MQTSIDFDGFGDLPALRAELLAFIDMYCEQMTLSQARDWFNDAYEHSPDVGS